VYSVDYQQFVGHALDFHAKKFGKFGGGYIIFVSLNALELWRLTHLSGCSIRARMYELSNLLLKASSAQAETNPPNRLVKTSALGDSDASFTLMSSTDFSSEQSHEGGEGSQ